MEKLRAADLRGLSSADREQKLARLVDAARAPRNGQARFLDAKITGLEARYEMTSAELVAKLGSGELPDTAEFSRWLILLQARDRK